MKRLLFIVHYFHPDVASTAQLMTDLCRYLQKFYKIDVISAVPSYLGKVEGKSPEIVDFLEDIRIFRVGVPSFDKKKKLSRIKNILSYFIRSLLLITKAERPDMIFAVSQPPVLGGLLGLAGKILKGSSLIYNIQDFNPEQIEAVGYLKNKFLLGILKKLDVLTCRHSDSIVVVGRDMAETLHRRSTDMEKVEVINNWVDEESIHPLHRDDSKLIQFKHVNRLDDKLVFMYSGNMGLYYDLKNILMSLAKFRNCSRVYFVFAGEGTEKQKLIDYCRSTHFDNVIFLPYQPREMLNYSLNAADIHIVSNSKGIKGISVPSKIYGIMAAGKYALGIIEEGSEAAYLIKSSGCGRVVEPGDYKALIQAVEELLEMNIEVIRNTGQKGRIYLVNNLAKKKSLEAYLEIFKRFEK